jgi:hypothetical protein
VIASSLAHPDGSVVTATQNKIVLSVIHLEQESFTKSQPYYRKNDGDPYQIKTPPLHLNLHVMVSSNYDNYLESLKMLSGVMRTFQAHAHFTSENHPSMPTDISKLTLEMYNIPITELSPIWSCIGAAYVPSVTYKMRMIAEQ